MASRIQLRRDTAANWARVNPILEDGEPGLEIDTNYIKYGDGNTFWNDLNYFGGLPENNGIVTFPGDLLVGTLWPNDPLPGGDKESVVWAKDNSEYLGLWWGGDQIYPESGYGPVAGIMIGSGDGSLTDDFTNTASPVGTSIVAAISDSNGNTLEWAFNRDGTTSFPNNNTIAAVLGDSSTVKTTSYTNSTALNFDGTNQSKINFSGLTLAPSASNSFTIKFLFKLNGNAALTQYAFLGSSTTSGISVYTGQGVGTPSATTITVDLENVTNQQFTIPTLDNNWHYMTIVKDGNIGSISMWYDGTNVGSFNNNWAASGTTSEIGAWTSIGYFLDGAIANIRITNTVEYAYSTPTIPIPAALFEVITGTQLLLQVRRDTPYLDISTNNFVMTVGPTNYAGQDVPVIGTADYLHYITDNTWNFGTGGSLTFPNGAQIVSIPVQPMISNTTSVRYYDYDAQSMTIAAEINDTVQFPAFSGQILLNDHLNGQVEFWLCGGGWATRLGTSKDAATPTPLTENLGTIVHNSGILGYEWTCNQAGTYVFVATRTRNTA